MTLRILRFFLLVAAIYSVPILNAARPADFMAKNEGFSVDNRWDYSRENLPILRIQAQRKEAFTQGLSPDLIDVLTVSRSKFGRLRKDEPMKNAFLVQGYFNGQQVYSGKAAFSGNWQLTPIFDLYTELSALPRIPATRDGLATLADKIKAYQGSGMNSPDFENAVVSQTDEIARGALAEFEQDLNKSEVSAEGTRRIDTLTQRMLALSKSAGAPSRKAITDIREKIVGAKFSNSLDPVWERLKSIHPARWDDALILEENFAETIKSLRGAGREDLLPKLQDAIREKANELLGMPEYIEQFTKELAETPVTREAVSSLAQTADVLQGKSAELKALLPYVEKTQNRMGEILVAYSDQTIEAIAKAGSTVDDIPALIAESEGESAWLEEWDVGDMGAAIQLAATARAQEIAEAYYETFAASLSHMAVSEESLAALREKLAFMREHRSEAAALDRYAAAITRRMDDIRYELDADTYKKLGLGKRISNVNVSVAGHVTTLAEFSKNIQAHGHSIKGVKTKPAYSSDSGRILGLLGWGTPEENLSAITVRTQEGAEIQLSMSDENAETRYFVPDVIRKDGQQEELYSQEWVMLALGWGAIVPDGYADENGVTDSDRFASDPIDKKKVVADGIFSEDLNLDIAIAASVAAIEKHPDEPRYKFNLGRALLAAGETQEAIRFLEAAADDGYGAAALTLCNYYLELCTDPEAKMPITALRRAVEYYPKAIAAGYDGLKDSYAGAKDMLNALQPTFEFNGVYENVTYAKAFYQGDTERLAGAIKSKNPHILMYAYGIVSQGDANSEAFRNSQLEQQILSYMPREVRALIEDPTGEFHKASREDRAFLLLAGMMWLGSLDDGVNDGQILMDSIKDDDAEVMRLFTNIASFLKGYDGTIARQ